MKKLLAPLALLFALFVSQANAQWQVCDHCIPIGNGAGVTGFQSAAPVTNGVLWSSSTSADPSFTASPLVSSLGASKAVTAVPSDLGGDQRPVSYFSITSDNVDAGTGFILGAERRYVFGGSSVKGGRAAGYDFIANTAATHSANANRNYVGTVSTAYSAFGDGGTNTSSGAKGGFFGSNPAVHLDTGATYVFDAAAQEVDITISTGASARYARAQSLVGFNAVRGAEVDAAQTISGGTGHIGFKHGILFTDVNGVNPFYASSVLLGSYWQGSTPTIDKGVDLSGFTITTSAFASTGFSVNGSGHVTTPKVNISGTSNQIVFQSAGVTGTLSWTPASTNKTITLPNGTTDFTATSGVVQQASSGAAFTVSSVALSSLATQATNTVVGNATSGTAVPTALSMTSCSTAASAVIWTTNTGFGCNTSITAAAVAVGGITGLGTGVATALAVNVGSAGAFVTFNGALGTPSSGTVTNLTGTASININGTVGATTPSTGAFTTVAASTSLTSPLEIGGSATNQAQTFQTTTGVGSGDTHVWKGGNNGATTRLTLSASALTLGANVNTITVGDGGGTSSIVQATGGSSSDVNLQLKPKGTGGIQGVNPTGGTIVSYSNNAGATASTNYIDFGNSSTGNAIITTVSASTDTNVTTGVRWQKGSGSLLFQTTAGAEVLSLTSGGAGSTPGGWTILNATAIPAGGTAGAGYKFSSTSNFGIFFGSGAPSLSAAQGSVYLRSDGSSTSTRMYINTNGSTTWTNVTTGSWLFKRDLNPANDNTPAFLNAAA